MTTRIICALFKKDLKGCLSNKNILVSFLIPIVFCFKSQPPLQVVVWVGPHKGRLHARPKGRVSQALSLVRL